MLTTLTVFDILKGSEVDGGTVLGVGLLGVAFFGESVQRLVSLYVFLCLIFLEVLEFLVMISVNRDEFWSY